MIMARVSQKESVTLAPASALVQTGYSGFMNQRIDIILDDGKRKSWKMQIVSIALVVALFLASYLVIVQPAHLPPEEYGILAFDSENSHIVFTIDGIYRFYTPGGEFLLLGEIKNKGLKR